MRMEKNIYILHIHSENVLYIGTYEMLYKNVYIEFVFFFFTVGSELGVLLCRSVHVFAHSGLSLSPAVDVIDGQQRWQTMTMEDKQNEQQIAY